MPDRTLPAHPSLEQYKKQAKELLHDATALEPAAVRACTDSYWKYRRQPDSAAALLAAGATTDGINVPTGYDAIDDLLRTHTIPPA